MNNDAATEVINSSSGNMATPTDKATDLNKPQAEAPAPKKTTTSASVKPNEAKVKATSEMTSAIKAQRKVGVDAIDLTKIPFLQAKKYTNLSGKPDRKPRCIVIHTMSVADSVNTAERVAKYFSTMDDGRDASAHYCIDRDSIVQCVQCRDVAWGAKGMNRHGIHLELSGFETLTGAQWQDPFAQNILHIAARLCGEVLMPKYGIIPRWLSDDQIRQVADDKNLTGFTTHMAVTRAMHIEGGHTDPGNGFPLNQFMNLVQQYANAFAEQN